MVRQKYVFNKHGTYHYQRDYPTKLKHLIQKKTFTYPLQLKVTEASELEIQKAALRAEEAYQRQLVLVSNSDPDALSATEVDRAVADFLRKRGLVAGQYLKVAKDPDISAREEQEQRQLQPDGYDYADLAIPEFEDVLHKDQIGQPLTLQDKIVGEARMKLVNKINARPKTLGSLWGEYVADRQVDQSTRAGQKSFMYWSRWISLAGDALISGNTLSHINDGLDAYVASRQGSVGSATLTRELSDVMACLRLANITHRFGWHLVLPRIKPTASNKRHPLEPKDQIALVTALLRPDSKVNPKYSCAMLLCLQGGMMVSEIARLRPEDIALDSDIPHLKIVNETKNKDRKRIVPIVLGRELIANSIDDTIKWLNRSTESTPSGTLKKIMRRVTGNPSTSPHCLRHSFKINGQAAGVSVLTIASIAGWADQGRKVSEHLLSYGSEGISESTIMQGLYTDSQLIHKHLLAIKYDEPSNVISIHRRS
ncbi:site-specific integrase [bacterium]|jgi:integrase|nr:site-specific integrase [bacterium]|tara:strand:+ start:636 stop:2081 length:1446 start_codon:yes stop_codon:yes gene_type:complete